MQNEFRSTDKRNFRCILCTESIGVELDRQLALLKGCSMNYGIHHIVEYTRYSGIYDITVLRYYTLFVKYNFFSLEKPPAHSNKQT